MPLDVLGLVSVDTLDFLNGKRYVGGGGLATAWTSFLCNEPTTLYSVNSDIICNRIIERNIPPTTSCFNHIPLGAVDKPTCFHIFYNATKDDYVYKITQLQNAYEQLNIFLAKSENDQYIKLPASNFDQLRDFEGRFSVNPQGRFTLDDYCNHLTTSGFIFLNKCELLDCSKMPLLCALKYIESICQSFVITLGIDGAICYQESTKNWWHCPSIYANKRISSLGCGDAFAGGFLAAYSNKLSIIHCLAQGTISAYYAMGSPSNMITQWPSGCFAPSIVELSKYIRCFESTVELYKYINNGQNLCVNLNLSAELTQKFCWIYV